MSETNPKKVTCEKNNNKKLRKRCRRKRKHHTSTENHRTQQQLPHSKSTNLFHYSAEPSTSGEQAQNFHSLPSTAATVWKTMYESTVRWHSAHQMNYWKNLAEQRQNEIVDLRAQLNATIASGTPGMHELKSRSDTEMDESYLQFMEITQRHQIELAEKRSMENEQDEME